MFCVIVTDLDGTLLDQDTYDHAPAIPALTELKRKQIPLVLCSSKTAAEIICIRAELQNSDPFVVENGGGIYIPKSYFPIVPLKAREGEEYLVVSVGQEISVLQTALDTLSTEQGIRLEGFHHMSPEQLSAESGLSVDQARRALEREFDLPFRLYNPEDTARIEEEVRRRNLRLSRGGRFLHLTGNNDKGVATRKLLELYKEHRGESICTVGLGDSENDLAMLRVVQIPIIVPNPGSEAALTGELPHARKAGAPGPAGWNESILGLLRDQVIGSDTATG